MIDTGVYIGTDFEMVVTKTYIITFRRNLQDNLLESRLFKRSGQDYSCIGVCKSIPAQTEQYKPPMCWKTAFIYHGEVLGNRQTYEENQEITCGRPPIYIKETDVQMKCLIGSSFPVCVGYGDVTINFEVGSEYFARLCEAFDEDALHPALPSVCDENVGECLRLWNMGIKEEFVDIDGQSAFIGITINTNKHMYIFEMTPDSIYCRAARFVATNKGVVFNQNFRQGFEAYMIKDNMEASLPLSYDDSLFSSDSCAWNNRSVYWPLAFYHQTEITLHGCQGETYHWMKPKR